MNASFVILLGKAMSQFCPFCIIACIQTGNYTLGIILLCAGFMVLVNWL